MRLQKVSVTELQEMVRNRPVAPLRVGATNYPDRRAGEYGKEYSEQATMYYAKTENMKTAENQLLAICVERSGCCFNVHQQSNAEAAPGYIYALFP